MKSGGRGEAGLRLATVVIAILGLLYPLVWIPTSYVQWGLTVASVILLLWTAAFDRNYYLPFLDRAVYPTGLLKPMMSQGEVDSCRVVRMRVGDPALAGRKVVYWGSSAGSFTNPRDAYGAFKNAGVTKIDPQGEFCDFFLREIPGTYDVPWKGTLRPHVHFRVTELDGMLGEVQTFFFRASPNTIVR